MIIDDVIKFNIGQETQVEPINIKGVDTCLYINEFWTSRQRMSNNLHELAYRACFKAELPKFFITRLTKEGDTIYDPFAGRGTTIVEAALLGRRVVSNDINPLSKILCAPRLDIPTIEDIEKRLEYILSNYSGVADIDLSMFYHKDTLKEILSIREYLKTKIDSDNVDNWIRMLVTNRLTGHSAGFLSVYSLPPNQAVTPERQIKINEKLNQTPNYKNTFDIVIKKSKQLMAKLTEVDYNNLSLSNSVFLTEDAANTSEIESNSVSLTVTSPPFLSVVDYKADNWLRCWFNHIDIDKINISSISNVNSWSDYMAKVFVELYRITKSGGHVAFEVGEVDNKKIKLEDYVVPIAVDAGFKCLGVIINSQTFTKTSNIWGIKNNSKGTNTNRIILVEK